MFIGYIGNNSNSVEGHLPGFFEVDGDTPVYTFNPSDLTIDEAKLVNPTYDGNGKLLSHDGVTVKVAVIIGQNQDETRHSCRARIEVGAPSTELLEYTYLHEGIQNGLKCPGTELRRGPDGQYPRGSGWYTLRGGETLELAFLAGDTESRVINDSNGMREVASTPMLEMAINHLHVEKNSIAGNIAQMRSGWVSSASVAAKRPVKKQVAAEIGDL